MIYVVGAAEGIRKRFFMLIIAAGAAEDKFVGREVGQHQGARARARDNWGWQTSSANTYLPGSGGPIWPW